jgi:hypothetical protein
VAQRRKRIRDVGRCADVVARERDETEQISGTPRRAIFFFFFFYAPRRPRGVRCSVKKYATREEKGVAELRVAMRTSILRACWY